MKIEKKSQWTPESPLLLLHCSDFAGADGGERRDERSAPADASHAGKRGKERDERGTREKSRLKDRANDGERERSASDADAEADRDRGIERRWRVRVRDARKAADESTMDVCLLRFSASA